MLTKRQDRRSHWFKNRHSSPCSSLVNVYCITLLGGVDRGVILLFFCIVEPPDRSGRCISVRKPAMVNNPNSSKVPPIFGDFVGVSLRGLMGEIMRKFNHCCLVGHEDGLDYILLVSIQQSDPCIDLLSVLCNFALQCRSIQPLDFLVFYTNLS